MDVVPERVGHWNAASISGTVHDVHGERNRDRSNSGHSRRLVPGCEKPVFLNVVVWDDTVDDSVDKKVTSGGSQ